MSKRAILYSFRRCPYAIRARLAIASAGVPVTLREIRLREKPIAFLALSPSGTVPCLSTEAEVLDESLNIMTWALGQNDPARWLQMRIADHALISYNDGPFKQALDRVKYASRLSDANPTQDRADASVFLLRLEGQLTAPFLFGAQPTLADMAILPFVRQFAFVDKKWFDGQPWPRLKKWLEAFLISPIFLSVMDRFPQWAPGDPETVFPAKPFVA